MAAVVILDKHKDLFKNEEAFRTFARVLKEAVSNDAMPLVIYDDSLVGALLSPDEAEERLRGRIMKRVAAASPGLLDTLRSRLESDDLVE
jgi:hypothetical protein